MRPEQIRPFLNEHATVTIKRNYATWTGEVVALIERPSVLIETERGRVAIVLEGAELVPDADSEARRG